MRAFRCDFIEFLNVTTNNLVIQTYIKYIQPNYAYNSCLRRSDTAFYANPYLATKTKTKTRQGTFGFCCCKYWSLPPSAPVWPQWVMKLMSFIQTNAKFFFVDRPKWTLVNCNSKFQQSFRQTWTSQHLAGDAVMYTLFQSSCGQSSYQVLARQTIKSTTTIPPMTSFTSPWTCRGYEIWVCNLEMQSHLSNLNDAANLLYSVFD